MFVDYVERTVPIYGHRGEEAFRAYLLGSGAVRTWKRRAAKPLPDLGAAATIIVPDSPRVGVTRANRYEPELQRSPRSTVP
jgi:hypothetical protein